MSEESSHTQEKEAGLEWLAVHADEITDLSDEIWGYAEPALREYDSAKAHERFLEARGFDIESGVAGMPTAFVATYGSDDPVIGFYAEYDATPGNSQEPVARREPVAADPSAAGYEDTHNGLGTGSTAAACAVKAVMEEHDLPGQLKVFGTPAEKLCIGKPVQAREGLYDDLDAVVAWHPWSHNTVTREYGPSPYRAVIVDFEGEAFYAAKPWHGASALDANTLMQVMVNFMKEHVPRQTYPSINELVTDGGQSPTNIPHSSQIWYAFRSTELETMDEIEAMLRRCANAAADVTGCDVEFRVVAGTRPWLPNHTMTDLAYENLQLVGPPTFPEDGKQLAREILAELDYGAVAEPFDETLTDPEEEITKSFALGGADDVNEFSWHAPTCWIHTGYYFNDPTTDYLSNTPSWATAALAKTSVAHTSLLKAAETMACTALDLLTNREVLEAAQAEYENRTEDGILPVQMPDDVEPPTDDTFPPFYPDNWSPPTNIG